VHKSLREVDEVLVSRPMSNVRRWKCARDLANIDDELLELLFLATPARKKPLPRSWRRGVSPEYTALVSVALPIIASLFARRRAWRKDTCPPESDKIRPRKPQ